jgi:hypothetical protein
MDSLIEAPEFNENSFSQHASRGKLTWTGPEIPHMDGFSQIAPSRVIR